MTRLQRVIQVRGHRIYLEQSQGIRFPRVVLLHHGLGSVQAWRLQIDFLVQKGFSVLAYDRWGYGRSEDRASLDPPFFEEDVRDLEFILTIEKSPTVFVGHSDGGNLALSYASRHADTLLGLIVVAPHIYFEPKMAEGIRTLYTSYQEHEAFRQALESVHEGKAVFERWYQAWCALGTQWDMRPCLSNIICPVLVIQGSDDEHATIQHAQDCASALPNGRLRIFEGSNHMLPQQNSDLFNKVLFETIVDFQKVVKHVQ